MYGVELSAQGTDYGAYDPIDPSSFSSFSSMIDLKLRGGMAMGKVLPYAFLGYSSGDWNNSGTITNPRAAGPNFGVGVDFQFNAQMLGGVEYIYRQTETAFDQNDNSVTQDFGIVQLRIGMRF